MPLDERVRASLRVEAERFAPDPSTLERVRRLGVRRRRRDRTISGVVLAIVVGLIAVAAPRIGGVLSGPNPAVGPQRTFTPPPPPPYGEWQSDPISSSDIRRTLAAAGLRRFADGPIREYTATGPVLINLQFSPSGYQTFASHGGVVPRNVDLGTMSVSGDTLRLVPRDSSWVIVYRWALVGGELQLTFVRDTSPRFRGTPDEVYQRVLYTSATFRPVNH
jgi:hypothetical protein